MTEATHSKFLFIRRCAQTQHRISKAVDWSLEQEQVKNHNVGAEKLMARQWSRTVRQLKMLYLKTSRW